VHDFSARRWFVRDRRFLTQLIESLLRNENRQEKFAKEVASWLKKSSRSKSDLLHFVSNPKALDWALRNLQRSYVPLISVLSEKNGNQHDDQKLRERFKVLSHEVKKMRQQQLQSAQLVAFGELSAGILHDLRHPLGVMMGCVQLMKEKNGTSKNGTNNLKTLEQEARRALHLVRRIEGLVAPSAGSRKKSVDIHALLQASLELVRHQKIFCGFQVKKHFAPKLPKITVVPTEIEQVFINLMLNAAEAMEGEGCLTLKTEPVKVASKRFIKVYFKDTGSGISKEKLKKIFSAFFTTKKGGMGLGLSMAQSLIKKAKGKITAKSQKGKGSEFVLWLPV